MDIKGEIRRCRQAVGMNPRRLAVELGYDPTYIRKVESGEIDPALARLRHMGGYFRRNGSPFCAPLEQLLGLQAQKAAS